MSFARVRALAVVGVLVVAAAIVVVFALVKDKQTGPIKSQGCEGLVVANLSLPTNDQVKINVFNATDKPQLANDIGALFKNRKFVVGKMGNDPLGKKVTGVAELRYGPKMVGAAWLLRAYFLAEADVEFNIDRTDDTVDVVLGQKFKQLATTTEVNQSLSQLGEPTLPKGTCAAPK